MNSDLCPSVYLKRLKISCSQGRAGSSPAPSTFYTQYVREKYIVVSHSSNGVRTQFLRTRPQLTSAMQVGKPSGFVFISSDHSIFLRDKRDVRDCRENFLSHNDIYHGVAGVALIGFFNNILCFFVKYSLPLRKNCVIWSFFLSILHLFQRVAARDYESLVSTLLFFSLLHYEVNNYGHN